MDAKKQAGYFTHGNTTYRWHDLNQGYRLQRREDTRDWVHWEMVNHLPYEALPDAAEALSALAKAEKEKDSWIHLYTFSHGGFLEVKRDGSKTRYCSSEDRAYPHEQDTNGFLECYRVGLKEGLRDAKRSQEVVDQFMKERMEGK